MAIVDEIRKNGCEPVLTGRARGLYFATLELPSGQKEHVKLLVQD